MNGATGSSQHLGDRLAARPAPPPAGPDQQARRMAALAAGAIVGSILIMIAASVVRNSWENPFITMPEPGPPWVLSAHVPLALVSGAMWLAALMGGGGVALGLAALRRGALPPVRLLVAAALVAVAAFTVLPPTGSTDALDYAAYGRITVLGHDPYLMTPAELRRTGDPVGRATPAQWRGYVTVYEPLATTEQWAAAEIGGASAARIAFWLKLWTSIAFLAVVLALDRMARSDPARRARAHLMWSANPLLLWVLVAAGHVDMVATAAGFFGLAVIRPRAPDAEPGALRGLAAGLLVGMAADIKISYILFGVGLAWAARRSVAAWLGALAGAAVVLVPTYLWFGYPAVSALLSRDSLASVDNFYQMFVGSHGHQLPYQLPVATAAFAAIAVLLWRSFPDGLPAQPAIRPALVVIIAWLFVWPYQLPWYDAMAFCLLALYPASRLDWLVLARLTAATFALMPGNAGLPHVRLLSVITSESLYWLAPAVLLAAAVVLVWLCVTGRWEMDLPVIPPVAAERAVPA